MKLRNIFLASLSLFSFSLISANAQQFQSTSGKQTVLENQRYHWAQSYFQSTGQFAKAIPFEVIFQWPRAERNFNGAQGSDSKCQVVRSFSDIAYPGNQSFVSYPFPADPFSFSDETAQEAERIYARAFAEADQILKVSFQHQVETCPANNECCKKGNTKDSCEASTGNYCELDGYDWCKVNSNNCQ